MTDKIEVTQRARDFAADYLEKNGQITSRSAEDIRAGEWDETRHVVEVARLERDILATRTDATPTCWMYRNSEGHTCVQFVQGLMDLNHWTETPLYTHPPATDVAALVEAAKAFVDGASHTMVFLKSREKMHPAGQDLYNDDVERLRKALEVFNHVR